MVFGSRPARHRKEGRPRPGRRRSRRRIEDDSDRLAEATTLGIDEIQAFEVRRQDTTIGELEKYRRRCRVHRSGKHGDLR